MAIVRKTLIVKGLQGAQTKAEIEAIRQALIKGEESGEPRTFDAVAFKRKMRKTL